MNYVNKIFCAYNGQDGTLVINFGQDAPQSPAAGNDEVSTQSSEVASIVMTLAMARKLETSLGEILPKDE